MGTALRTSFLTAEWRHIVMLNYAVLPELLESHVPGGTELDDWKGTYYVSLVGFLFLDTSILGFPIPFHRKFEEVNLRFYVRRNVGGSLRRGVVFIKEIVPKIAVTMVARLLYNENYHTKPMTHELRSSPQYPSEQEIFRYSWGSPPDTGSLELRPAGPFRDLEEGSEEEFITEHFWGYSAQSDGSTIEYEVAHPRWRIRGSREALFSGDAARTYGKGFGDVLGASPKSAFLAGGSPVTVFKGSRLTS